MKLQESVPLPAWMKKLPKDKRGYPIPYISLVDDNGAHFTITDEYRRQKVVRKGLCAICGRGLTKFRYLVGGPIAVFHPDGAFLDPAMHKECAEYALKVCPFLAMPSYAKRIDEEFVKKVDKSQSVVSIDDNQIVDKPSIFLCVAYRKDVPIMDGFKVRYVKPMKPYVKVSYWKDGVEIAPIEGLKIAKQELEKAFAEDITEKVTT